MSEALNEIEALMRETLGLVGMQRYAKFQEMAALADTFAEATLYRSDAPDTVSVERLAYANLHHNAVNSYCTAWNFTKNQFSDIPYRHHGGTPYTAEEVQAVIDRNDAVAVQNYADIIRLFKLLEVS